MIRKAGQRIADLQKALRTETTSEQRIAHARRHAKGPGQGLSRLSTGHVGLSPMNVALFQGDGYSAMSQ